MHLQSSEVAGVTERVGDHRLVDEHEEGQIGQEVQQVQWGNALQFKPDGRLLLQMDAASPQLQKQLLTADEAPSSSRDILLLLQEEEEKLLQRSG